MRRREGPSSFPHSRAFAPFADDRVPVFSPLVPHASIRGEEREGVAVRLHEEVRFSRGPGGAPRVHAPAGYEALAEFLVTDVRDGAAYVRDKLAEARRTGRVAISLDACHLEADRAAVRLEHLYREDPPIRCTLPIDDLLAILDRWEAFLIRGEP